MYSASQERSKYKERKSRLVVRAPAQDLEALGLNLSFCFFLCRLSVVITLRLHRGVARVNILKIGRH